MGINGPLYHEICHKQYVSKLQVLPNLICSLAKRFNITMMVDYNFHMHTSLRFKPACEEEISFYANNIQAQGGL